MRFDDSPVYGQSSHQIRFDWGLAGARHSSADMTVVVDVFSFSTSVCIAVGRGMEVHPFAWRDEKRASEFAESKDAVLAVGRWEALANDRGGVSGSGRSLPTLSPAGLLTCEVVPRLVLPSPNGSSICAALETAGEAESTVVVGCLLNVDAVAKLLRQELSRGRSVALIAAGERWADDDSLRPAVEDQLGAGAILSQLLADDLGSIMSPEACVCAGAFDSASNDLESILSECVGARELRSRGFDGDVSAAIRWNSSAVVPILSAGAFR